MREAGNVINPLRSRRRLRVTIVQRLHIRIQRLNIVLGPRQSRLKTSFQQMADGRLKLRLARLVFHGQANHTRRHIHDPFISLPTRFPRLLHIIRQRSNTQLLNFAQRLRCLIVRKRRLPGNRRGRLFRPLLHRCRRFFDRCR